ncbi:hypothetical protein CsSME_00028982 [Camellia sinensis var. sinensis]
MFEAILINQLDHTEFRKGNDLVVNIIREYNAWDGTFRVGGRSVCVSDDDIKLIFGIQCGFGCIDLTPRPKPSSDFVQRRCLNTSRITSKLIWTLLVEAAEGSIACDVQDTAKLLCLYACGKLFFSNSGETISWALIRYVDNLDAMKTYDWTGVIRSSLMSLVRDFYRTPEKVTGCVVALMYWLCEHSTIISPVSAVAFPRFLKWAVATLVTAARGVNLSGHVDFEVTAGRLITKDHEVKILEVNGVNCARSAENKIEEFGGNVYEDDFVDMGVEGNVTGRDGGICGGNVERGLTSVHFRTPRRNVSRNAGKYVMDVGPHVCYATEKIAEFEVQFNEKDIVISELRAEVDRLRQANEVQMLHLVRGFGSLMQAKDDEVKKLTTENAELQRAVNVLEEQLAEREVHNMTQAFHGVDVNVEGVKYGLSGNEHVTDLTNNTTPNRVFAVTGDAVPVWDVTPVREQTNGISEMQHSVMTGREVVDISPNMAEGGRLNVRKNSFVRDVKCKV